MNCLQQRCSETNLREDEDAVALLVQFGQHPIQEKQFARCLYHKPEGLLIRVGFGLVALK